MITIGFIGRTRMLYDTIRLFQKSDLFSISFIWTCKDEEYYNFSWKNFETLSKELNCEFIYSPSVTTNKMKLIADIVISVNFLNLLPIQFLNKFRLGVLNAHAGDLPKYQGNACPNWAIINAEESVTLSIHKMSQGLDSGPILLKESFNLKADTYIGDIYEWLEVCTPKLFIQSAESLIAGKVPEPQKGRPFRTFPRKPEDSRLNFEKDRDWNYRLIRASSRPFSGAYCYLNGSDQKVVIFRARPIVINYDFSAINGQIMERSAKDNSFLISINNEVLKVTDYSVDGKTIQDSFDIVCSSLRNRLA